MNVFEDVREFHAFFGHTINDKPVWIEGNRENFRVGLIEEELKELKVALAAKDMVEVADALADLMYVTIGTAVEMGIPLQDVWEAVQKTNIEKAVYPRHSSGCDLEMSNPKNPARCTCGAVLYTETGKTKKPDGWTPPNDAIYHILRSKGYKD